MNKKIETYYAIVSVEERLPPFPQIVIVLIDGRIPFMAQIVPNETGHQWESIGSERKVISKGVTHWLSEQQGVILSVEEWKIIIETLKTCSYSNVDYESQQVAAKQALSQLNTKP